MDLQVKKIPNGEIVGFKAKWIVNGFGHWARVDYHEMFTFIAKPVFYISIFAIRATLSFEIEQLDDKNAFL